MSIEAYQQIANASSGGTFAGHYHHFSEGLFVNAAELLSLGDVAIDAGCYEGSNAFAFARSVGTTGKVFTFEPDPRLYQRASDRIASGEEGASSISLTNFALGDEEGDVEFLIVNEIEGHSGLAPKASYGREVTYTRVQRRLRKLDNFLAENDIDLSKVKAIKFDLEGAELKAFRGARVITHGVDRPAVEPPPLRRSPGRACLLRGWDLADSLAGWAEANWNG